MPSSTRHTGLCSMLGLTSGSWGLVGRGLADRVHQSPRAGLFPRSYALLGEAGAIGAIGATISGAGPAVLFWCVREETARRARRPDASGRPAGRACWTSASRRSGASTLSV